MSQETTDFADAVFDLDGADFHALYRLYTSSNSIMNWFHYLQERWHNSKAQKSTVESREWCQCPLKCMVWTSTAKTFSNCNERNEHYWISEKWFSSLAREKWDVNVLEMSHSPTVLKVFHFLLFHVWSQVLVRIIQIKFLLYEMVWSVGYVNTILCLKVPWLLLNKWLLANH